MTRRKQKIQEARYNFLKGIAMGLCIVAAFAFGTAFSIVIDIVLS